MWFLAGSFMIIMETMLNTVSCTVQHANEYLSTSYPSYWILLLLQFIIPCEFTQFTLHMYYRWVAQRTRSPAPWWVAAGPSAASAQSSPLSVRFPWNWGRAGQGAGGWGREGGLWQQPCQLDLLKKKSPSSVEREPWNALNCWAPVSHSHPSPPESPIRSNLITAPGAWLGSK